MSIDVAVPAKILSLFTGIGGLDLGVALALPESRAVCVVEWCAYCAAIIAQRMEQGFIPEAPIWDDVRTFNGKPWRGTVDILTAGYPCQGFSVAGKREGENDPRYLWPEVARVVGECNPALVFLENVARHLSHGFERVAGELQGLGYTVAAMVCRAATMGAPHQRERLFALAVSNAGCKRLRELTEWHQGRTVEWGHTELGDLGGTELANSHGHGLQEERTALLAGEQGSHRDKLDGCGSEASLWPPGPHDTEQWSTVDQTLYPSVESPVRGVVDGLSNGLGFRRHQLHALGNAVVPVQAAYAFVTLANALQR